ncbi:ribosomal protein 63, mitochondrial [Vespa crabro]|uniref:ribosomal protein 63, mitochondrial n=1 Tax=Vespa crabro TaxID=7445 RepID=UPI001F0037B5|nr:ribosomal protein 63, mitochondrial [Vespa crabro]
MRLGTFLLRKEIPYRFRGKYRKIKNPTFEDLLKLRHDIEREERNMLILRHPYLTSQQSAGHMSHKERPTLGQIYGKLKDEKFSKCITIQDRLSHLKVLEPWD